MITDKLSDLLRHSENDVGGKTNGLSHHFEQGDLLDLAGIGLWVFDACGETVYVNGALAAQFGVSREEMLTQPVSVFTENNEVAEAMRFPPQRKQEKVENWEAKFRRRDGREIWCRISSIPMSDANRNSLGAACVLIDITESKVLQREIAGNNELLGAILSSAQDITKLKQAEHSLRRSEERYRTILENIRDGYFECDLTGKIVFCNEAFCLIHGLDEETILKTDFRDHVTPEMARQIYQAFHAVYLSGEPLPAFEIEFIKPDGTPRYIEESVSLIRDEQGNPTGFRGIVRDTTERKLAEEARRESEEKFRSVANEAPVMLWMAGPDHRGTFLNQRWLEFTGRSLEEDLGDGWLNCVHPDDYSKGLCTINPDFHRLFVQLK
jgi:PAS domain S-box-containing protein